MATQDEELAIVAQMAAAMVGGRTIAPGAVDTYAAEAWLLFQAVKKAQPDAPKNTLKVGVFNG